MPNIKNKEELTFWRTRTTTSEHAGFHCICLDAVNGNYIQPNLETRKFGDGELLLDLQFMPFDKNLITLPSGRRKVAKQALMALHSYFLFSADNPPTKKVVKEKVARVLKSQMGDAHSKRIDIPFTKPGLAFTRAQIKKKINQRRK